MEPTKSTAAALAEIVKLSKGISVEEMAKLADVAQAAGGGIVGVDPDGDWCGTGRFKFKWPPPKPHEFERFLDVLVDSRIHLDILINGVPVPDEILVRVAKQAARLQGR
jgi:hypothetical protein